MTAGSFSATVATRRNISVQKEEMQQPSREQILAATERNIQLLSITFEVLKQLIQEKKTWSSGLEVSHLASLHCAAKYVYERWEREKNLLQPRKNFLLHTPLHSTIMGTKEHSVESTMMYLELMAKTTKGN